MKYEAVDLGHFRFVVRKGEEIDKKKKKRYEISVTTNIKALFFFQPKSADISYFSMKTYVVGTHLKHLPKALLMSTYNMFSWRKIYHLIKSYE